MPLKKPQLIPEVVRYKTTYFSSKEVVLEKLYLKLKEKNLDTEYNPEQTPIKIILRERGIMFILYSSGKCRISSRNCDKFKDEKIFFEILEAMK